MFVIKVGELYVMDVEIYSHWCHKIILSQESMKLIQDKGTADKIAEKIKGVVLKIDYDEEDL